MRWIIAGFVLAYFVYSRHGGDWKSARDEVVEKLMRVWTPLQPRVVELVAKAKANKAATVVVVVVLLLIANRVWDTAKPQGIDLVSGPNNVYGDLCNNEVTFGVVGADEDGKYWTPEMLKDAGVDHVIGPGDVGRELSIYKPFSPVSCARPAGTLKMKKD